MDLSTLKKNLKKDLSGLTNVSVALLGDTPTQLLALAIKGYGVEDGYNVQLYEAEYNQIDQEVLNISSDLYQAAPKFLIIFQSAEKLILDFYKLDKSNKAKFAESHIEKVSQYFETVNSNLKCNVYGNYANKIDFSFTYQIRKINFELMNLAMQYKNLFISDVCSLQNQVGRNFSFTPTVYSETGMVFSLDFLPLIAKNSIDIIKSISGKIKKCIILDLDNTMWGGIIGDDGMEGIQIGNLGIGEIFTKFQYWIKQLKERGIILAVCSKNEEDIAKEPFEKHPDMVIKMDDIAVFVANWNNKADNIKHIQNVLNIGFDSMVFIDDNPAERKIVRDNVKDIVVPELPEDNS